MARTATATTRAKSGKRTRAESPRVAPPSVPPYFLDAKLPDRFWNKVQPCPMTGCWIWVGHTCKSGYGIGYGQAWDGDRVVPAHRYADTALADTSSHRLDLD